MSLGYWLIESAALQALEAARAVKPTAEQITRFESARRGARRGAGEVPPNLTVNGSEATVRVEGVLSEEPDFWAWILGIPQTSYGDIRDAIDAAMSNPAIRSVVFEINSPGGQVDGLFETLASVEGLRSKKTTSVIAKNALSAAYAIAAMAGPIQAMGPSSSFGSVGVAMSMYTDPQQIDIASTEAPKKRPDVTTDAGKAIVREELDALHAIFADAVARGRGTTVARVNADFGRGGSLLAAQAKSRGMIDGIASTNPGNVTTKVAALSSGGKRTNMNPEDLKAMHPATYAAVVAVGVAQERDRVRAHLKYGEQSGAMQMAIKAVRDGADVSLEMVAEYLTAARGKFEIAARQADSDLAGEMLGDAAFTPTATKDLGDLVADKIEAGMGKTPATVRA